MTTSVPAHDRWVCAACRWTAKHPVVDVRADDRPRYSCPHCPTTMVWAVTALRAPRRTDGAGWATVPSCWRRGPIPVDPIPPAHTPHSKELAAWLARSPTGWRPEQVVVLEAAAAGVVERVRVGS